MGATSSAQTPQHSDKVRAPLSLEPHPAMPEGGHLRFQIVQESPSSFPLLSPPAARRVSYKYSTGTLKFHIPGFLSVPKAETTCPSVAWAAGMVATLRAS